EDGAPVGDEAGHVEMVAALIASAHNQFDRVGVRVHDFDHPVWRHEIDVDESVMRSPGQFEHRLIVRAKAEVAASALAHAIVPCHCICMDTVDPESAFQDASRARREYGFLRMASIHPVQIEPIVRAMSPQVALVGRSAAILLAGRAAQWGPIKHAGEMHDRASYRYFWQVLQRAKSCGMELPAEAETAFFGEK